VATGFEEIPVVHFDKKKSGECCILHVGNIHHVKHRCERVFAGPFLPPIPKLPCGVTFDRLGERFRVVWNNSKGDKKVASFKVAHIGFEQAKDLALQFYEGVCTVEL
jgi:hypothetical protein